MKRKAKLTKREIENHSGLIFLGVGQIRRWDRKRERVYIPYSNTKPEEYLRYQHHLSTNADDERALRNLQEFLRGRDYVSKTGVAEIHLVEREYRIRLLNAAKQEYVAVPEYEVIGAMTLKEFLCCREVFRAWS